MKLHHIGIATEDAQKTIEFLQNTVGVLHIGERVFDPLQGAWLCMLNLADGNRAELVTGKVVEKMIRRGMYIYHLCYEVENIEKEKKKWMEKGAVIVSDEKPAVLFNNRRVCFLMSQIGMIELLENEYGA